MKTEWTRILVPLSAISIVAALFVSCPNPVGSGQDPSEVDAFPGEFASRSNDGALQVRPAGAGQPQADDNELRNLWITVPRVMARGEATGWHIIEPEEPEFDLLRLTDDLAPVGVAALPPDRYIQLRLILTDVNRVVFASGEEAPLIVPSGQQTGIKITGEFDVREGYTVRIALEFDAGRSLRHTGRGRAGGRYLLTPVIRIREVVLEPEQSPAPAPPPSAPEGYARLVIDTYSPNDSFFVDTFIDLFGADGDTNADVPWDQVGGSPDAIASADNGNLDYTFMARVDYTDEELPPGTYYIRVRGATEDKAGYYAIRVLAPGLGEDLPAYQFLALNTQPDSYEPDDLPRSGGVPTNPVPIRLGNDNALSRSLHYDTAGDIDWFVLELP